MVLCVGIPEKEMEKFKQYLLDNDVLVSGYRYEREDGKVWMAVEKQFDEYSLEFMNRPLQKRESQKSWREAAKEVLSEQEHDLGKFSYDTVGTIAIVEIVTELALKEKELAELLLQTDKHISTVLKKMTGHEGELRTQKMHYLAGEDTRETIVHENGVRLYVNVEEVYYSIRLGTERNRIMKLVQSGEKILCMFSGIGPFPIVFAKNTEAKKIVGVELNETGHKLALRNNELNKTTVEFFCGDVATVVPTLEGTFDRITMPLPHTGQEFLPIALEKIQPSGVIHYYSFIEKENVEAEQERIRALIEENGKKTASITPTLCGQHSPRRYRVCFDIKIQ